MKQLRGVDNRDMFTVEEFDKARIEFLKLVIAGQRTEIKRLQAALDDYAQVLMNEGRAYSKLLRDYERLKGE